MSGVKSITGKVLQEYIEACKNNSERRSEYCRCGHFEGYRKVQRPVEPTLEGFAHYLKHDKVAPND